MIHDFQWYEDRLNIAHRNSDDDFHAGCPVCGGSDPLHVTRKNSKALVKCFSCDADIVAVTEALEDEPTPITITKTNGAATAAKPAKKVRSMDPRPAYSPSGAHVADQVGGAWKPALRPLGVSPSDLHGGLATVADVDLAEAIILCEGHGPAIALNKIGIPAVATVTGKSSAINEIGAALLYGRRVILSPDVGGEEHMERNGAVIARVAAEVLIAPEWPENMADGEDAAQYLERHGPDAMREFYAKATTWEPAAPNMSVSIASIERVPPEPLVDDFAHPHQHTGLWGPNGAGKGVLAAEKIAARTKAGETVLILDYEGHGSEWRARLEDLGANMNLVYIALPVGLDHGMLKGALWDQQDKVRAEADRVSADWLYVDSVSAACGVANIGDSTAPGPYFAALNIIGRPSVSLAHVTKTEDLKYPFGSQAWRAFIRMGWSFAAGPARTRELVNRKTNDYPEQASFAYDWSWSDELPPQSVPNALKVLGSPTRSLWDRISDALGDDSIKAEDLLVRVREDGYEEPSKPTTLKTLQNNLSRSNWFEQPPGQRGLWRRVPAVTITRSSGRTREEPREEVEKISGKNPGRSREEGL